jgi:hypothetical protein
MASVSIHMVCSTFLTSAHVGKSEDYISEVGHL